jgi:hypothetical protein
MNIDQAIAQLELLKQQQGTGDLPLQVYVQTGADSWLWKKVQSIDVAKVPRKGLVVNVDY